MTESMLGIIDVGSNSIRLCVYTAQINGKGKIVSLKKFFDTKQTVGLAAYMHQGKLSEKGIHAAEKAIRQQLNQANIMGCQQTDVFATAAIRNCTNSKAVIAELQRETGHDIELLSGLREAALGVAGLSSQQQAINGLCIDIGGGSTEISSVVNSQIKESWSIPCGALSLWSSHVQGIMPTKYEILQMRTSFQELLQLIETDLKELLAGTESDGFIKGKLYGLGGSVRMAAKVYAGLTGAEKRSSCITAEQTAYLLAQIEQHPGPIAHAAALADSTRVHTFAPGCVILDEIFTHSGAEELSISSNSIREGYLYQKTFTLR